MRIRKVLDKKVGNTSYYKYLMTLPKNIIEDGEFQGEDVKITLKDEKIIIEKKNPKKKRKLTNEEKTFRNELLRIIEKD